MSPGCTPECTEWGRIRRQSAKAEVPSRSHTARQYAVERGISGHTILCLHPSSDQIMLCCTGAVLFNLHRDCVSSGPWLRLSKGYNALSEPRRPSVDSGSVAYSKMHFTGLCTSCTSSRSGSPRSARASGERARSSMSVPTMSAVGPDACPTDRLCILNTHAQRMMSTFKMWLIWVEWRVSQQYSFKAKLQHCRDVCRSSVLCRNLKTGL